MVESPATAVMPRRQVPPSGQSVHLIGDDGAATDERPWPVVVVVDCISDESCMVLWGLRRRMVYTSKQLSKPLTMLLRNGAS